MSFETSMVTAIWVALLLLGLGLAGVLRMLRELHGRLDQGRSSNRLGAINARLAPGRVIDGLVRDLAPINGRYVIAFGGETCESCKVVLPELSSHLHSAQIPLVLVYHGSTIPLDLTEPPYAHALGHDAVTIFDEYGIKVTPYLVVVEASGMIAEAGLVGSLDSVAEVVGRAGTP